jgi:hypothetical protein
MTNDMDFLKMDIMEYDKTVESKRRSNGYLSNLQVHYATLVNVQKNTIFPYHKGTCIQLLTKCEIMFD